jgi:hypothetical protein
MQLRGLFADQTLRISSFLLELLYKQPKKYGFLNVCKSIHAVEETFFSDIIVALDSRRFLGNLYLCGPTFRHDFRPLKNILVTQILDFPMYCNII